LTNPPFSLKPNTTTWQAVIFDLDDTLYLERDFVFSGFRAVAIWSSEQLGLLAERNLAELTKLFNSGARNNTFDTWLASHGITGGSWVSQMVQVYREHQPTIAPFREVPLLLADLGAHYQLGLVSDGYLAVQRRKMIALELDGCFDAVALSDEWGRDAWKPAARPFQEVLARLGSLPAAAAVYIADNPAKDFFGARRAGLASIRLRHKGGLHKNVEALTPEHAADWGYDTFDELRYRLLEDRVSTL